MTTDIARQDQTPATPAEPQSQWSGALEQARSLVNMPEREWQRMWQVSQVLAGSSLVPKVLLGNPQGVMAVGLHCRALNIPFTALSVKTHFHVWESGGNVVIQPAAQLMLGLLHRAGHDAWWGPCDEKSATLIFVRAGTTREQEFTYTIEMAAKADLLKKDNWKHHPDAMLRAGACRLAGRYGAPAALMGLEVFDPDNGQAAAAGPQYDWETPPEALGDRPELSPAEFDRPVARLHRQIQALPTAARAELATEWGRRKLPPVQHPDFIARLADAEDLVDEMTTKAFALPPEADTTPDPASSRLGSGQTALAGSPTAGAGRADAPGAVADGSEAGLRTDRTAQGQPPSEPARPLAQQIAMQAQRAGVDHHHVIWAVTNGEKSSAKAVDNEEGQMVLEAIDAIGRGEYDLVEKAPGEWRFTERRDQATLDEDLGRAFE